jgi:hypothetical protein
MIVGSQRGVRAAADCGMLIKWLVALTTTEKHQYVIDYKVRSFRHLQELPPLLPPPEKTSQQAFTRTFLD